MKKNYQFMVGKIAILLFFLQFSSNASAQIVHSESFDSTLFLPPGWSSIGNLVNWSRVSTLLPPLNGTAHSGTGMARMRYPVNQTVAFQSESMVTPSFTLEGRGTNTPTVSFWIYRDSLLTSNPDSLSVYINTTISLTGATRLGVVSRVRTVNLPDVQILNGWYQYTFNVPVGFSSATNYLIFKGTVYGPQATSRRIYLDDVNWDEYPVVCAGSPIVGSVTSADTVICGGSGSTELTLGNVSPDLGYSYAWFSGPTPSGPWTNFGNNVTSLTSPVISSSQYVICTVACSYSQLSASSVPFQINVSPDPVPVVSILTWEDTICRGDVLTLFSAGASTYEWSSQANPTLSSLSSIDVSPLNSTDYTLVGTDINGCKSNPVTKTIEVGRRPTIDSLFNSTPSICVGGSSTLGVYASGGQGTPLTYLWAPTQQTTSSIVVNPTSTTDYIVTVYGQYGCSSNDTISVLINPSLQGPNVVMNTNTLNYCAGSTGSTVLVANTTTPGATFQWSATSGGPISSVSNSLPITIPLQNITYTVVVTNPVNGCNSTASTGIFIRPVPATNIISQNQNICLSGSAVINLFIGNTGGDPTNTYTAIWSPSGQSGTTITVNPVNTGYQVVNVTSQYGCSKSDSILITVNTSQVGPNVNITASDTLLCSGSLTPVSLYVSSSVIPTAIVWTPQTIISTNDTIVVSPNLTTNYSVSVTDANGCSSSDAITITVEQSPVASFTHTTGGLNDAYFTNTTVGGTTFSWNFGDGTSAFASNPSHIYAAAGNYFVTLIVTTAGGCSDTISKLINVGTAGLDEVVQSNDLNLIVYPNPSKGLFNVEFNSNESASTLTISNLLGEVILKKEILQSSNGNFDTQIDLSNYPNGIYLIDLHAANQNVIQRISKQ